MDNYNYLTLPPIIKQYLKIKSKYKNYILLYRMGDFYEFFFEDAIKVSKILDIVLSKRTYYNAPPIPFAGIPAHVVENYIKKLLQHGESVAICEQIQDKDKDKDNLVKRKVIQIITPGTICDDSLLDTKQDNLIGAIYEQDDHFGYATLDITSGMFVGYVIKDKYTMQIRLQLTKPVEVLYPNNFRHIDLLPKFTVKTPRPYWEFDTLLAKQELNIQFEILDIDSFGCSSKLALQSAGCILHYVKLNSNMQNKPLPHIQYLKIQHPKDTIWIDDITLKNLQIIENIVPSKNTNTLFNLLDNNCTLMGSRLLKRWLINPIRDNTIIEARQQSISYLQKHYPKIQPILQNIGDLERILARLSFRNIKPRDLVVLRKSLKYLAKIKTLLGKSNINHIDVLNNQIPDFTEIYNLLDKAIASEPPSKLEEGGVIKTGFDSNLDKLRMLALKKENIKNLETKERKASGIRSLKIMWNHSHGYFIQIKKSLANKLPSHYHRIQTLKSVERFITFELKEYENHINRYHSKALSLETVLLENIIGILFNQLNSLVSMMKAISELDLLTNLAERSVTFNYVCPKLTNKKILKYTGGRHPLVENYDTKFVKNDLCLSKKYNTFLITGPNMGGKSTYMKQTAIIAILTYIGCFVPADSAIIGPIDCIFSRMGVHDDLTTGKSSFMVEMIETANILNNASENSLVLIDEICKGTNPVEGISISFGCIKHLLKLNSFNLISTHYIVLTKLFIHIQKLKNIHFTISQNQNDNKIIFAHKLKDGVSHHNSGIFVAKIAGLPSKVIKYADTIFNKIKHK